MLRVALVAIIAFAVYQHSTKTPGPGPEPDNEQVPALAKEIAGALKDAEPDTAIQYAAFYDLCAATLDNEETATLAKLRTRMERAKALLGLSSPEAFKDIVVRELRPFESGQIDRAEYAEAFRKLSKGCKGAAK